MENHDIIINMTKIIVTGGAGFIGSNLVDALVASGNDVVVIDNLTSGKKEYLNPLAKFYQADIRSEEITKIFDEEKPDFVYHLAAQIEVAKSVADPRLDNDINVLGALNVLMNCARLKVKKIIFSSTGGAIYGEGAMIPTPESALAEPISPYGIHKLTFEKYLNYYYQVFNQNYAILRFANVYGPRQYKGGEAGVISIFIANAVLGKSSLLYGDGGQTRDFVFISDVVAALMLAKDNDCREALNIGLGREVNLLEVIREIEEATGKPFMKLDQPGRPGEQRRSCLDPSRAKSVLSWQAKVDLKEGIKETISWAQANKGNL